MIVNSLSGGIASAAAALVMRREGLEGVNVFANTKIEDEDLYRFLRDLEPHIGPIVYLEEGRTPWEVFRDKKYIGNSRTAHCSIVLKTEQVRKYIASVDPALRPELALGMYRDEEDRLTRAAANWHPVPVRSLLIDYKVTPGEARALVERTGVPIPRLYGMGFVHNNCGGFCVRAGQGQLNLLLEKFPERFAWHEDEMEKTLAENPKARPFLKDRRGGEVRYLSLREFREAVQSGDLKPRRYEMGGCGCFVDDER